MRWKRSTLFVSATVAAAGLHGGFATATEHPVRYAYITAHYFHPTDRQLGDIYGFGRAYAIGGKIFFGASPWGCGVEVAHSEQASSQPGLGSLITDQAVGTVVVRLAEWRAPARMAAVLGFGVGVVGLEETTVPSLVLSRDPTAGVSDASRTLVGYRIQVEIPIQLAGSVGLVLQSITEFAWLDAEQTNFRESFAVGGVRYGAGIAWFF